MPSQRKISIDEVQKLPTHPDPSVNDPDIAWLGKHLRNCACRKCRNVISDVALGDFNPKAYAVYMAFLATHGHNCRQSATSDES